MKFKVDTGAEVTALTEEALSQLGAIQLKSPSKVLCGPDRTPLKVLGQTMVTLEPCKTLNGRKGMGNGERGMGNVHVFSYGLYFST